MRIAQGLAGLIVAVTCVSTSISAHAQQSPSLIARKGTPLVPGVRPNGDILYPPLSYDGRYIAFQSMASNLVPNDRNNVGDIFILDLQTRLIQRLSVNASNEEGNRLSTYPSLSGDGRYTAFTSDATNFAQEDNNNASDVFVANVENGTLTLVSRTPSGRPASGRSYNYYPAISSDGRYIVFNSDAPDLVPNDTNNTWDVFVFDRVTGSIRLVSKTSDGSVGNGPSMHAVISGNGQFVAFQSRATNLVANDINGVSDIFLHNLQTGETTLISRASNGSLGNARSERASISHDGMRVSFSSSANNLVPGDTNDGEDVFVFDQRDRSIRRVSVLTGGAEMKPSVTIARDSKSVISPSGTMVAFRWPSDGVTATATSIFVHEIATLRTEETSRFSNGSRIPGNSEHHALSYDGSMTAFSVLVPRTVTAQTVPPTSRQRFLSAPLDAPRETNGQRQTTDTFSHAFIKDRRTGRTLFIVQ